MTEIHFLLQQLNVTVVSEPSERCFLHSIHHFQLCRNKISQQDTGLAFDYKQKITTKMKSHKWGTVCNAAEFMGFFFTFVGQVFHWFINYTLQNEGWPSTDHIHLLVKSCMSPVKAKIKHAIDLYLKSHGNRQIKETSYYINSLIATTNLCWIPKELIACPWVIVLKCNSTSLNQL